MNREPINPRGLGHLPAAKRAAKRAERERMRKIAEERSAADAAKPK